MLSRSARAAPCRRGPSGPCQGRLPSPCASPAAPARSLEELETLGRKTELQRDNVECKYQLNMHYHMPAPSRSVRRQHEPVKKTQEQRAGGSEERASSLPAWHPQPTPEPLLTEARSCGSAPALLPSEGSPLPAHCPAEAAADGVGTETSPLGPKQRRGAAALLRPPKPRAPLAQAEDPPHRAGSCSLPGEGTPSSGKGMKQLPHRQHAGGCGSEGRGPRSLPGSGSEAPV